MIEGINNPLPESSTRKERIPLTKLVQLRVSIQYSSWDELVEDTDNERWEDSEDDVVEGECPWFEGDLTWEVVEERELIMT